MTTRGEAAVNDDDLGALLLRTARAVASKALRGGYNPEHYEDMVQALCEAGVGAARRYDPSRGVPLNVWVHSRMRQAVADYWRAADRLPRPHRAKVRAGATHQVRHIPIQLLTAKDNPLSQEGHRLTDVAAGDAFDAIEREQVAATVRAALLSLPQRTQGVINDLLDGVPIAKTAANLGVHESRISQIRRKAYQRLAQDPAIVAAHYGT